MVAGNHARRTFSYLLWPAQNEDDPQKYEKFGYLAEDRRRARARGTDWSGFRLLFLKDETLCSKNPWHQQKKAGEYVGTHTTFRSLIPGYKLVESRVVSPEST